LDPPYENTNIDFGYAEDTDFYFERLATLLRLIKGKFLMSINDSPNIRRSFKGFNIKPWKVITPWQNAKDRDEF
jgi:DNA adenine methylase